LNACPVYQQVGGHAYGSVYPGPIGAVITPQLTNIKQSAQLPYASSLCGACREVCPVKIDIPALLLHLRAEVKEGTATGTADQRGPVTRNLSERLAFSLFSFAAKKAWRYEFGSRIARLLQGLLVSNGRITRVSGITAKLSPPLAAWTDGRDLPPFAEHSFRELWRKELSGR
jgi:L-lactate dehydrogenase complex protein LldF